MTKQLPRHGKFWAEDDPRRTELGMALWIPELVANALASSWVTSLAIGSIPGLDLQEIAQKFEPEVDLVRSDGSAVTFPISPVLNKVLATPDHALTADQGIMLPLAFCIVQLGDALEWTGLRKTYWDEPVIQFLRHVRNGVGHGGYFAIRKPSELETLPARMKDLQITPDLNGLPVFGFMMPGDAYDLFEEVGMLLISNSEAPLPTDLFPGARP